MTPSTVDAVPPHVSVVIATYNRVDSLKRLLQQLACQTLPAERFEVVVLDDGSPDPVGPALCGLSVPYDLRVATQTNAGPAAARHHAIQLARGDLIVTLDDDMCVAPEFLGRHLAAHPPGSHCVVLGRMRADPSAPLPLFVRATLGLLDKLADNLRAGRAVLHGLDLYTANLSLNRSDYFDVGGFDPSFRLSEDAELGLRLEQAGLPMVFCEEATATHASGHTSATSWMRQALAYGGADARVAEKHPDVIAASPWRFLFLVNPVSRPWLLASALFPSLMRPVSYVAMGVSLALDWLRATRLAIAGVTFAYGVQYFAGVRAYAGTRRATVGQLRRYLNRVPSEQLGLVGRMAKCLADIRADQEVMHIADEKYGGNTRRSSLAIDAVQRIGFQMLVGYRVMRLLRALHLTLLAKISSRLIRHLYAADIHWDADLAAGVVIVHGTGLVIGGAARVGPRCVLFQHVTLGESIHPETREVGGPTLEEDVHVGPGAAVLGPIVVGRGTKVAACALLMSSVEANSIVQGAPPEVRSRTTSHNATVSPARNDQERSNGAPQSAAAARRTTLPGS